MALLNICDTDDSEKTDLSHALAALPPQAPVVIMIHGFRYAPGHPRHDPSIHLFCGKTPRGNRKSLAWPRHMRMMGDEGLAIGFGWDARPTIWQAYFNAAPAGNRLARLILRLRTIAPGRPVHIFAHSLGARVALSALPNLRAGDVDRMVFMAAAAFSAQARRAMATECGRDTTVVNVRGAENAAFEALLRLALPHAGGTVAVGRDIPNWITLPLDRPETLQVLADIGHQIAPPKRRICHWSGYLRRGVFGLYRDILLNEAPLAAIARAAGPKQTSLVSRLVFHLNQILLQHHHLADEKDHHKGREQDPFDEHPALF